MTTYFINFLIKIISINLCVCYSSIRITHIKNISRIKLVILILLSVILAFFQYSLINHLPVILRTILVYYIYSIILTCIIKIQVGYSIITTSISLAITYIINFISTSIVTLIFHVFLNIPDTSHLIISLIAILNVSFVYILFKLKRLKDGFVFIKSNNNIDLIDIFALILCVIIIFMYFMLALDIKFSGISFMICFIVFTITLFIVIQKFFVSYQKQKLQTKALKDYEKEIEELKQKLDTALTEKQNLVKSNHEFYHRQEALNKKLDDLMNNSNAEFGDEYGELLDRINNLSKEYSAKTSFIPKLPKTNITEIDDMLSYMQSECNKNNIEFNLQIDCSVNYMINNFISKSQLETLLGDLIRNAIIAVNHSNEKYKSIMVVFGIKDDNYQVCVLDSGIPFEINTLLNLGITPASTHESEGGTGIGFITTFETLASCNASLIINEITNNNFTKSLEIIFDGKHEYVVISNRKQEINDLNSNNRNIILL